MRTPDAESQPNKSKWALSDTAARSLLLVFACFTLLSSGYLAWLYHLLGLVPAERVELLATGAGYLFQGFGIGIGALFTFKFPDAMDRMPFVAAIVAHFACAALASMSPSLAMTLASGYAMNLLCGFVSAFYLLALSQCAERHRGTVFGVGYALSTVATWLLSLVPALLPAAGGAPNELIWCALFSVPVVALALPRRRELPWLGAPGGKTRGEAQAHMQGGAQGGAQGRQRTLRTTIALACTAVLLMSMMKGIGGGFPSAEIGTTVDLESSRLLYAVGLLLAGFIIDWSRVYGAVLCAIALVVPFAMLALSGEPIPASVVWAIDYLLFGFFSVYRVVLFADLADKGGRAGLSGFGLMLGRFGDALGTFTCIALMGRTVALVVTAIALFVATALALVNLAQRLYRREDEAETAARFGERCGLSRREQEVFGLLLAHRTNPEIAEALVVSENTVKFHVRNVLKKTGCNNRAELQELYSRLA